jgi:2-polyprenyl-3-methyl-5-hydroxy-6-metoxy-1,4-benzoquinol methylase
MTRTQTIDATRAQAFAGRMTSLLNDSMLALMVSIGHRTGLFDTLATLPPATSAEIAHAAGLDERYVREWLGAMVTGRIVDFDGARGAYHLPREHAGSLTRAAGPANLGILAQAVGEYGFVEDDVVRCFREGGGVPYTSYRHFHEIQGELSGTVHDAALIDVILPLAGVTDALRRGIDVLDVGCGRGGAVHRMARAFPASLFTGIDIEAEPIADATREAEVLGLRNARFLATDAARLAGPGRYDLITGFDVVHDQADPAAVLAGIRAALRPGGVFLCVDIAASSNLADNMAHPLAPALYAISTMHCMTVSLAQGGAGLGTMWGQELALKMLAEAGFRDVELKRVDGDILNNYYVAR